MLKVIILAFIFFCLATEPVYSETYQYEYIPSQIEDLSVQWEGTQN